MKYLVREIVGEDAMTLEDEQTIYDRIKPELMAGHEVELDNLCSGGSVSSKSGLGWHRRGYIPVGSRLVAEAG